MIIKAISGLKWRKVEEYLSGYYGQFQTTMDSKGRFALPAKLRSVRDITTKKQLLNGNLLITKGLEGCLSLYDESQWKEIQQKFASLAFTQKDFRFFSRRFYSSAGSLTADKNGRVLIPSHLISEAGLKKEVLVIGVNSWIEIWNPERYQYYLEQYPKSYEEVAEKLFSGDGPPERE